MGRNDAASIRRGARVTQIALGLQVIMRSLSMIGVFTERVN
jgi:hypothetical protein